MKRTLIVLAAWLLSLSVYAQDCPELECIQGLGVTLYPGIDTCAGAAWATDFVTNDLSNCTPPLSYAIYRRANVMAAGNDFTPNFNGDHIGVVFGMSDISEPSIALIIYVQDGNGVIRSCSSSIWIRNDYECPPPGQICYLKFAGFIATEGGEGISEVNVNLTTTTDTSMLITDQFGSYLVYVCDTIFQFFPTKEDSPLNGVSTFDLVLMSKHILGVDLLDSPYKMIAADVNNSGTISTLDLIHLRRLILGIYTVFPDNSSWRFIPENYEFTDPLNPWSEAFPETITIGPLPEEILNFNFIGIKIGDVSGNASGY